MSAGPIRISRKEFSSEEVLDYLDDGRSVIVTMGKFGVEKEISLRKSDEEYVCDTGVKLLSYDDRDGMRECIERLKLTYPSE